MDLQIKKILDWKIIEKNNLNRNNILLGDASTDMDAAEYSKINLH